jgi:hypothetical protein
VSEQEAPPLLHRAALRCAGICCTGICPLLVLMVMLLRPPHALVWPPTLLPTHLALLLSRLSLLWLQEL